MAPEVILEYFIRLKYSLIIKTVKKSRQMKMINWLITIKLFTIITGNNNKIAVRASIFTWPRYSIDRLSLKKKAIIQFMATKLECATWN
jgi:hypothetical protein